MNAQPMQYIPHTVMFKDGDYEYAFANGIKLWKSRVTIHGIGFPIHFPGDVFCLLRAGKIKTASDIPARFRNW